MFGEFLNIIVRSIKLDKTLYKDNKIFGEAAIYYAGIIMILDGIAGAVAANTIIIDGGNNNPPPEPPQNNDTSGSAMSSQIASVNSAARLFDLQALNKLG